MVDSQLPELQIRVVHRWSSRTRGRRAAQGPTLRDFEPRPGGGDQPGKAYKLPVDRDDVPVPDLLRYALR